MKKILSLFLVLLSSQVFAQITDSPLLGGGSGSTSITSSSTISDNAVVRGDGGSRGVQGSLVSIDDTGLLTAVSLSSGTSTLTALTATNSSVSGNSINVSCSTITTGFCINSNDANALTTGAIARLVSNAPSTATRNVFFARNQNSLAVGTTVAQFQQDAANTNVTMTQNANGVNLLLQSNATTNASLRAFPTLQTSASIISVPNADTLDSGSILNMVSASNSNTARNLIYGEQASTTATSAVVARFVQAGPAGAFVVDRTNTASTNAAWTINDSNASSGGSIQINKTGTGFGNNVGLINIARTGNLTGVDTQAIVEFSITPAFTLTESASGTNLYAAGSINLSGVNVTATGSTTTNLAALLLVASSDSDSNNYALISNGASLFQTTIQIGNSGSTINGHFSGTATNLTSASIAAGTCADYGTITVTGAAVGNTVTASPDASSSATGIEDVNLSWNASVTASNTVTIRACNPQAVGAVDAGNDQEWRADVWSH